LQRPGQARRRADWAEPDRSWQVGSEHGSGPGAVRSVVENANAWLLNNKRLDRRHDRSASITQSLLTIACIFVIANRLADL
jgi:hypothetical protein